MNRKQNEALIHAFERWAEKQRDGVDPIVMLLGLGVTDEVFGKADAATAYRILPGIAPGFLIRGPSV